MYKVNYTFKKRRVKYVNIFVNLSLGVQSKTAKKKPQNTHTTTKYYGPNPQKRAKSQRRIACNLTARQLKSAE